MNESSPSAQHGFSQNNVSFKHINPPLFFEDISKSYSRPTANNPASNTLIQRHSRPTVNNPASNTLNQSHSKDIKQKRLVSFQAPSQERRKSSKNKSLKFVNDPTTDNSNRRNSISIRKSSTGQKVFTFLDDGGATSFETLKPKELKSLKTEAPKELKIDYLSKAVFKEGYDILGETFDDILHKDITDDYLQCMYVVSSYTINNYFGVPGPKSDGPQKLSNFLNQLIPLNPSLTEENLEKSKHIPSPTFVLTVQVIEAVDLMAMDADGLSDPFCKIWLNDKEQLSKKTEVKEGTLNPVWNETFQFYLEDMRSDTIYIEIWDRDPIGLSKNLQQIKKVKSLGGCWYFCKDLVEDFCTCGGGSVDDLIGKTEIEVGDLFAEGSDEWLSLEKESGEFQKGLLHVAVKIEAVRPEDNNKALKRHLLLVKLCLEYGLKNHESSDFSIFCWDQILNTSARTLLFQHGVQSNINAFEDMACRFITVIHLALDHLTFAFQFLYNVLNETNENLNHLQSLSDDGHFYSDLQDAYQQALENLRSICTSVLSSLHTLT
ncbi:protein unc-13 4B [Caerostris darwini]|uniref:Protein unc-13 4B n=1 Tax=Caerostris darwini TaxID=1538125 RepID=A0AAV4TB53_9ARAC|nr:protein unc-13 4B [Caerostris darwini]